MSDEHPQRDPGQTLALHPLVYLAEGDDVTIGRADIDSYAVFPADGAQLVRWIGDGATPAEAAARYALEYGEQADVEDLVAALGELGFIREAGEAAVAVRPIRGQRLGRALFSPVAWLGYGALTAWAAVTMLETPALVPTPHAIVFSKYYSVVLLTYLLALIPMIMIHEAFHALAGRALGVRSRTVLSYRLYFLVMETSLDGLVTVPRRKRVLPILAGMLADCLIIESLVIAAGLLRGPDGALSGGSRVALGLAFATLIRVIWQFFFYIRTDVYVLISTLLGCADLHAASVHLLTDRFRRLLGRPVQPAHPDRWPAVDLRHARWYSWLLLVGYCFSLSTFLLALGPAFLKMLDGSVSRFGSHHSVSVPQALDSVGFAVLTILQFAVPLGLAVRDRMRRRRSPLRHVIA
jgi:hypothetical protein